MILIPNVDLIFLNILKGHLHFYDKQIILYDFYKIQLISKILLEIKTAAGNFLHRGQLDPRLLTKGPEGPLARPRWTRSTWPAAGRGLLGTEAWEPAGLLRRRWRHEGGGEKAQPDQKLTGESPMRSAGSEEGRRRAGDSVFWRWRALVPAGKMATAAVTRGAGARFLRQGSNRR
jgi:hypothetical protein